MNPIEDQENLLQAERLDALIADIERLADPVLRAKAQELVQGLLDYHGAGLRRLVEHIDAAGDSGRRIIEELTRDPLVSSLLLLHGLHPTRLETRVEQALERVRPMLRSHGGDVELLSVVDGVVRLRMQGSCNGCPSSSVTLRTAIEEAINAAAPDLSALEVEGVVATPDAMVPTLISLGMLTGQTPHT